MRVILDAEKLETMPSANMARKKKEMMIEAIFFLQMITYRLEEQKWGTLWKRTDIETLCMELFNNWLLLP